MEIKNCKILENRKIGKETFLLKIENNFTENFKPGQFISISIPPFFLRRPFSICKKGKDYLSILYRVVGKGTAKLKEKNEGEYLNILGPCGNGFKIDGKTKNVWIIAGGVGIAPLIFLSEELKKRRKRINFFYGERTNNSLVFDILPTGIEYIISTDDGSYGHKGTIFSIFKKEFKNNPRPEVIYSAGPEPLLKEISSFSRKEKISSFLSLENFMGCGIGLCYGCVVKIKKEKNWEYKRVCKEGPVFKSEEIIWE